MYTLWRDATLLGEIKPMHGSETESAVFGVLLPTVAFLPGSPLSQSTMWDWPGIPVFQQEPIAANDGGDAGTYASVSVRGRTLADALKESVPYAQQLVVRDEQSNIVPTQSIAIMRSTSQARTSGSNVGADAPTAIVWRVIVSIAERSNDVL